MDVYYKLYPVKDKWSAGVIYPRQESFLSSVAFVLNYCLQCNFFFSFYYEKALVCIFLKDITFIQFMHCKTKWEDEKKEKTTDQKWNGLMHIKMVRMG